MIGLLGMSTKFTECTLGQMYRKVDNDGVVSGGPMRYLKDGLAEMGFGAAGHGARRIICRDLHRRIFGWRQCFSGRPIAGRDPRRSADAG